MFKRENKYLVLKLSDMQQYLSVEDKIALLNIALKVDEGRKEDGKQPNRKYVVISDKHAEDYEAAWEIVKCRYENSA